MSNDTASQTIYEGEEDTTVFEQDPEVSTADKVLTENLRQPSRVRRNKTLLISIGAVIVVLVAGYFIRNAFLYEDTDDAQVDGHVMPLSARINGQLLEVRVIEGQLVHAGDVLAVIDPKDYKVAVDQAKANLADAEASAAGSMWSVPVASATAWSTLDSDETAVHNSEAGIEAAEQNLESAKAELLQAEANAEKTDSDLVRYSQLVAKEDISRQQYDQASAAAKANRAAVVSAAAAVQSYEQALHQAEGKLLQSKADLRSAQTAPQQVSVARAKADAANAQVDQHRAELDQAELNLSYTVIRSPVNGIVGKKTAEVGQNVGIGQELMDVVPLDDIWVTANFKETQLRNMHPGQAVTISVDAYGKKYNGHLQSLSGASGALMSLLPPENATGNYVKVVQRLPVKITFDPGETREHILRPGMSVEPKVWIR